MSTTCIRCGKLFMHRGALNRHLDNKKICEAKHYDYDRKYIKDNYSKLILYHKNVFSTIEKPQKPKLFKCEVCGKSTTTERGLTQHINKYCEIIHKFQNTFAELHDELSKIVDKYEKQIKLYNNSKDKIDKIKDQLDNKTINVIDAQPEIFRLKKKLTYKSDLLDLKTD